MSTQSITVLALLVTMATACRADSKESADDSDSSDDIVQPGADDPGPRDYDPELPESESAHFSQSDVEQALEAAVVGLSTLETQPAFDAYNEAMALSEGYCPAWYETDGNVFWYASCTTESGTWFDGYGFYNYYEDYIVDEEGKVWDTEYISGAATVRESTGDTFHIGGYVQRSWTADADGWTIVSENLRGSFLADRAPSGTWIGDGATPSIGTYRAYNADAPSLGGYFVAQGSLGGLGANGDVALFTDNFVIGSEDLGLPCEDEGGGSLTVRTPDGGWWTVSYDLDLETYRMNGDCDGCGVVTDAAGQVVGEACAEFSPLLTF